MLVITAHIFPRPDAFDDLLARLREMVPLSRAEEGNHFYSVGVEEPGEVIMIFEGWRDMAALQEHLALPHIVRLLSDFEGRYTNKVLLHEAGATQEL